MVSPLRGLVRISSTRLPGSLRCFEGPAALQATSFVARRDQPAERAHSLGGKVARMCFHLQKLPQRSAQEGAQTAQAGNKRMRGKGHVGNFAFLLSTPPGHIAYGRSVQDCSLLAMHEDRSGMESARGGALPVSNSDQLFM